MSSRRTGFIPPRAVLKFYLHRSLGQNKQNKTKVVYRDFVEHLSTGALRRCGICRSIPLRHFYIPSL